MNCEQCIDQTIQGGKRIKIYSYGDNAMVPSRAPSFPAASATRAMSASISAQSGSLKWPALADRSFGPHT